LPGHDIDVETLECCIDLFGAFIDLGGAVDIITIDFGLGDGLAGLECFEVGFVPCHPGKPGDKENASKPQEKFLTSNF